MAAKEIFYENPNKKVDCGFGIIGELVGYNCCNNCCIVGFNQDIRNMLWWKLSLEDVVISEMNFYTYVPVYDIKIIEENKEKKGDSDLDKKGCVYIITAVFIFWATLITFSLL